MFETVMRKRAAFVAVAGAFGAISAVAHAETPGFCDTNYAIVGEGFDFRGTNANINYIAAETPNVLTIAGNVNGYRVTKTITLVGFTASGSWGDFNGAQWAGKGVTGIQFNDKEMIISGEVQQGYNYSSFRTSRIVFNGDISFVLGSQGAYSTSKLNQLIPFPSSMWSTSGKGIFMGATHYNSQGLPNGGWDQGYTILRCGVSHSSAKR
ncbi:hypothetical protein [Chromobacterium violaceum]|uniref:hypothetical protein n=1 Tax=Chromobacterium violaceum TaxID=536 RepID=UPI0012FD0EE0|nr:hypothetical protein [Chromobacterium violaceum]